MLNACDRSASEHNNPSYMQSKTSALRYERLKVASTARLGLLTFESASVHIGRQKKMLQKSNKKLNFKGYKKPYFFNRNAVLRPRNKY